MPGTGSNTGDAPEVLSSPSANAGNFAPPRAPKMLYFLICIILAVVQDVFQRKPFTFPCKHRGGVNAIHTFHSIPSLCFCSLVIQLFSCTCLVHSMTARACSGGVKAIGPTCNPQNQAFGNLRTKSRGHISNS